VWLADEVGEGGSVLATDIAPQHIPEHSQLEVMLHDVATMSGIEGPFDVIHARLVLAHLPQRREILGWLAGLLAPGGVLAVEEWGQWVGTVVTSPVPGAAGIYCRYQQALLEVFRSQGNDPTWATSVSTAMADAGLDGVDVEVSAETWRCGGTSPGTRLVTAVAGQLREQLFGAGLTPGDLNDLMTVVTHPDTKLLGNLTVSTLGHRPAA
jgi:hypothetical protein